jgi:hypothetical protein
LPAGVLRQVVVGTHATAASSSSATYADTGLTASITPSSTSNKILVLVFQAGVAKDTANTGVNLKLLRGSTDLITFAVGAGGTGSAATNTVGTQATAYLDSPASVSAVAYKTQFASSAGLANASVQAQSDTSVIVLLEVQG